MFERRAKWNFQKHSVPPSQKSPSRVSRFADRCEENARMMKFDAELIVMLIGRVVQMKSLRRGERRARRMWER